MLFTAPNGWGYFWAGVLFVVQMAKSLVKNALKSRMGEEIKKKLTPTIRCCEQHLMGGHIACSTIGKIICEKCTKSRMGEEVKKKLTPTIRCCSQHLMVGVIFGLGHNL